MEDDEVTIKENDTDEEELNDSPEGEEIQRMMGVQPIDAILTRHELSNHDLIDMNRAGLTHKQIGKARKGRRLTPKIKVRITEALNGALKKRQVEKQYLPKELFNY